MEMKASCLDYGDLYKKYYGLTSTLYPLINNPILMSKFYEKVQEEVKAAEKKEDLSSLIERIRKVENRLKQMKKQKGGGKAEKKKETKEVSSHNLKSTSQINPDSERRERVDSKEGPLDNGSDSDSIILGPDEKELT